MRRAGTVVAVCLATDKGVPKTVAGEIQLVEDCGVQGDAHAGTPLRQVSLLCQASADKLSKTGLELSPGIFAENLRVAGLRPEDFQLGSVIRLERGPVLEVSQIGKDCHAGCAIARQVGRCVMPTEGIFARVIREGAIRAGDSLEVVTDEAEGGGAGDQ